MVERIDRNQSQRTSTIADIALKFVLSAVRPLTAEELVEAISFAPAVHVSSSKQLGGDLTLSAVLGVCQNLLVLDQRSAVVRFSHFSVQEFLSTRLKSEEVHTLIGEICLTLLLTPKTNDGLIRDPDFTRYAAVHWPTHVRLSGPGSPMIIRLWKEFLSPLRSPIYQKWSTIIVSFAHDLRAGESSIISPLIVACHHQLVDAVAWLLGKEENPNCTNGRGWTPLHYAALNGNHHIACLLLGDERVDTDRGDECGRTPLYWAAGLGHLEVVQISLDRKEVDLNSTDTISGHGYTPLLRAAMHGHHQVVQLLLDQEGVDVNKNDNEGRSALSLAAGNGHEKVAGLLLDKAEVDCVNKRDTRGRTPLSWAAASGHAIMVKSLLEGGQGDVDKGDAHGRTPLSLAAGSGHEKVVKILLEGGQVDADKGDSHGRTPLSWAAQSGNMEVVQILLDQKEVDVNSTGTASDFTPLIEAVIHEQEQVVQLLFEPEAVDVNKSDYQGRTPLYWAAGNGYKRMVKLLLDDKRIQVDKCDDRGRTPLYWAARNGYEKVVQTLVNRKDVNVNSRDGDDGYTPLLRAAWMGHKKVVKILLREAGVVNSTDWEDSVALRGGQGKQNVDVVRMLLEKAGRK